MDFLKILVIISFVLVTIFTLKFHPEMHHPLIIEDADFKLTRISDTISTQNIPISSTKNPIEKTPTYNQKEIDIEQPIQQTITQPIEQSQTKYIQIENTKPKNSEQKINQNKKQEKSQIELLQQIIKENEINQQPKKIQTEKPQINPPASQNNNFKNPYMTEQEEIIAWNKWRSNIQNQIMRDSQIDYAPLGTMFLFTFVVDKFGNVSNIKVECSNPNFINIARDIVKPAIAKLQKKPILNFPKGTQRTSTVVTGIFLIGTQERYSTPEDFSDYERVTY